MDGPKRRTPTGQRQGFGYSTRQGRRFTKSTTTPADLLLPRLERVKQTGPGQYVACCPAHADRTPSLSVKQIDDRLLLHCFAGCPASDVVAAVGLSLADLFDRPLDHHRAPLSHHQRRRNDQAADALRALRVEALIILVAADQLAAGQRLEQQDHDRLQTAFNRITDACETVGARPQIPSACPELRRPSDFTREIIEEIHNRQAGEVRV